MIQLTMTRDILPRSYFIIVVTFVKLNQVLAQSIIIPPTDVAGGAGDDVTLTCRVDATTQSQWSLHISTEEEVTISSNNQTVYPEKYEIANRYDLQVKSLNSSDGGFYACLTIGLTGQKQSAKILMFEEPFVNFTSELVDTIPTNVTCTSTFYTVRDLDQTEWPDVMVSINGDDLSGSELAVTESHTLARQSKYEATRIFEYVPRLDDQVLCTVNTMAPINYTTTYKFTLDKTSIQYGVRNISISSSSGSFSNLKVNDDSITCWADGNPPPDVVWEAVDPPLNITISESVLSIVYDMCGNNGSHEDVINNTWMYTVENGINDVDGNPIIVSNYTTFQINASTCEIIPPIPTNPPETTKGPDGSGGLSRGAKIGIGCGVGGGVLVIVVIVIGVCCHRQKKKRKRTMSTEGSDGVVNPAVTYTTGDDDDGMIQPYGVVGAHSRGKTEADAFRPQSGLHYASAGLKVQDTAGPPVTSEYSLAKELPKADPNAVYSDVRKPRGEDDTTMWDNTTYVPYSASRDEHPGPQDGPRTVWNVGGEGLKSDQPPTNNQQEIPAPDYV